MISPRLSNKIDLPVPVSPVSTERPFLNSIWRFSIRTIFLTISSFNIYLVEYCF